MLVSNDDFMPNKPTNQNLIDQMKKKISSKDAGPENQSRSRSRTLNSKSLNYSSEIINAGRPINFQASTQPRLSQSINYSQAKSSQSNIDQRQDDTGSFISNSKDPMNPRNQHVKDLTVFEKKELPGISESLRSKTFTSERNSDHSANERYNTDKVYRSKLQKKGKTKNIVFKEMSSSGMDAIESLSSGFTQSTKMDEKDTGNAFANYILGFLCGFFLNIFGVLLMLCCTNKKKRCEGATHGMVVSSIVIIVIFNGYFFNVIKSLNSGDSEFFGDLVKRDSMKHGTPIGHSEDSMIDFRAENSGKQLSGSQPENGVKNHAAHILLNRLLL